MSEYCRNNLNVNWISFVLIRNHFTRLERLNWGEQMRSSFFLVFIIWRGCPSTSLNWSGSVIKRYAEQKGKSSSYQQDDEISSRSKNCCPVQPIKLEISLTGDQYSSWNDSLIAHLFDVSSSRSKSRSYLVALIVSINVSELLILFQLLKDAIFHHTTLSDPITEHSKALGQFDYKFSWRFSLKQVGFNYLHSNR